MDGLAKDTIAILQYLLPGFLAAWVYYGLTSHPKPSQFERIIQALIFTLLIQAFVFSAQWVLSEAGEYWRIGVWNEHTYLLFSTLGAIAIGILASHFANNDQFHAIARKYGITTETSYPSEWYGVFHKNTKKGDEGSYVVLHLKDGRRLYGWPSDWPSEPENGHFRLTEASWIVNGENYEIPSVRSIMINTQDVQWVEFMQRITLEEKTDG